MTVVDGNLDCSVEDWVIKKRIPTKELSTEITKPSAKKVRGPIRISFRAALPSNISGVSRRPATS